MEDESALFKLLDKLTAPKQPSLDGIARQHVLNMCRESPEILLSTYSYLFDRLKAPNSQSRLLALELCNDLFSRSKLFRQRLSLQFVRFLELTVGFRQGAPLPPPSDSAANLRERALAVVETWREKHGKHYKQLDVGYSYLKDTLQFTFPDVSARRAQQEQEEQERQARLQTWLREKYATFLREHSERELEMRDNLKQLHSCLELLEAAVHPPQQAGRSNAPSTAPATPHDGKQQGLPTGSSLPSAVKPAAQSSIGPFATQEARLPKQGVANGLPSTTPGPTDTLLQTKPADRLPKQGTANALPAVRGGQPNASMQDVTAVADDGGDLEWEEVEGRAPGGLLLDPGPEIPVAVVSSLREAAQVMRRTHLPLVVEWLKMLARVDVGDPGSVDRAQRDRYLVGLTDLRGCLEQAIKAYKHAEATYPLPSTETWTGPTTARQPKADGPTGPRPAAAGLSGNQTAASMSAEVGSQPPRTDAQGDAYAERKRSGPTDPTMPRKRPAITAAVASAVAAQSSPSGAAGPSEAASKGQLAAQGPAAGSSSRIPTAVKAKLLQEAPKLDAAAEVVRYWEQAGQSALQMNRGIEISNHWGPVDMDAELSNARRAELLGHVAQYYTPSQPSLELPTQRTGSGSSTVGAALRARQGPRNGSRGPIPSILSGIDGTAADESLARELQQAEVERTQSVTNGVAAARGAPRKKMTVRKALEKKLLSSRAINRATNEAQLREALEYRDRTANTFVGS